jgi:hypothetical protein
LLKLTYAILTLFLGLALYSPAHFVLQAVFPPPSGWGDSGLVLSMVGIVVCVWIADRITSSAFRITRLTDERWFVFSHRSRRRSSSADATKPRAAK